MELGCENGSGECSLLASLLGSRRSQLARHGWAVQRLLRRVGGGTGSAAAFRHLAQ